MKAILIAAMLLLATLPARATEKDKIEAAMTACLAKPTALTTRDMLGCIDKARVDYDALLNKTYQKALAALDPKSALLLRTAERKWVAYRTAEDAAYEGPWQESRGTIVLLNIADARVGALKERIEALEVYLPDTK